MDYIILFAIVFFIWAIVQCLGCWIGVEPKKDDEEIVEIVDAVPMTPRSAEEVHVKIKLKTSDMVYG
jgi:hypothetical protein